MSRTALRWTPTARPSSGLVRPVPLDPSGRSGPTRGQARSRRWRQTSRGLYVPAGVDSSRPEQRILEQSVRLPAGGAVTGWAAMRLRGAGLVDGVDVDGSTTLPVPLALGPRRRLREHPDAVLLRDRLDPDEVTSVRGIPCTTAERAVFDAMRTATTLVEAVVAMDMAAAGEVTSLVRMGRYLETRERRRGVPQARTALRLASEHSWSPNETRMRMVWCLEAGLPAPLVNRHLFDLRGRRLGVPDLLDVESGLVGEFDGADHRAAPRHTADVGREDILRRHGLEVTRVTGSDLRAPGKVRTRILAARRRARWPPAEQRVWTTEPPSSWVSGPSLDQLLDERDATAEIHRQWEREGLV